MAGFALLNVDEAGTAVPAIKVGAPFLYPEALSCAFADYTDHMREMPGRELPDGRKVRPLFFLKLSTNAIIGPDATVRLPAYSKEVHREAELTVEVGRIGRLHNPIVQGE